MKKIEDYNYLYGLIEKNTHVINHALLALSGGATFGLPGAIAGLGISLFDEALLYTGVVKDRYLVKLFIGLEVGYTIYPSYIAASFGVALGAIFTNYKSEIDLSFKPFDLSKSLYSSYSNILKPHQLINHISAHTESILITQVIHQQSMIKILQYEQDMTYGFEHLDGDRTASLNKLKAIALKFFLFVTPFAISELTSQIIKGYYSTKLYLQIDDNLRELLFANETALRLSFDKNATVLIDNLRADSRVIAYDGAKLISDAVSKITGGMYGSCILITHSPDLLVYSFIYNQVTQYVSTALSTRQSELDSLIKSQESSRSRELKHDIQNIRIISERRGVSYSKNKLSELDDQLIVYELERDQISIAFETWMYFTSVTDFIYNYYLVGYKISTGQISFKDRKSVHYGSWQVSKLLSWGGKKSQEIEKIYQSIERIDLFLEKINNRTEESNDKIVRVRAECHSDIAYINKLVLSDLTINVKGQVLVAVDHLELDCEKRYVLTGLSASGKSSLVSKIAGVKENQIGGEGIIYYPVSSKIVLVSQQDYFPLNVTLQEAIFYPDAVNQSQISYVKDLLDEVGITQYSLNQTENWYEALSGGQKKKVIMVSAVIKYPDILILDEVFNSLDKESIQIIQEIILKYLYTSLIISIDHKANENNQTGFYTDRLEIVNGVVLANSDKGYKEDIYLHEANPNIFFGDYMCYESEWPNV